MTLLCNLTAKTISEDMWKVLEMLYQVFEKEGFDYFTDMMPVLHNYITVDTNAFLSNENHILAMFNMAKAVSSFIILVYIVVVCVLCYSHEGRRLRCNSYAGLTITLRDLLHLTVNQKYK